jgi:hypothetical protein
MSTVVRIGYLLIKYPPVGEVVECDPNEDHILLENGDSLLLETGCYIVISLATDHILLETGEDLLLEDGSLILVEMV